MLCKCLHDDVYANSWITWLNFVFRALLEGTPSYALMITYVFLCVNYVVYTCILMPWTLESMRSLSLEEFSWRWKCWDKIWKFPLLRKLLYHVNWASFWPSKILKIFVDISQYVSYNFYVLRFSKIGRLDAQKNQTSDYVQCHRRNIQLQGILHIFVWEP